MQTFGSKRCALAATLGYNESNLEPNPKEQTAKQFAGPLHIRLVWAKKIFWSAVRTLFCLVWGL